MKFLAVCTLTGDAKYFASLKDSPGSVDVVTDIGGKPKRYKFVNSS